jgi:hypothetical protein
MSRPPQGNGGRQPNLRATIDEQLGHVGLTIERRLIQSRQARLVECVDVGTEL